MEPRTVWANVKGKSLLNDNRPPALIRLGETPESAPPVVTVCVCVLTSHTQSDTYNLYYLAFGISKEASGLGERTRQFKPSNYQLCGLNMSSVPSQTQFPHL